MEIKIKHKWDVDKEEAIRIQKDLRKYIDLKNRVEKIEKVAGVDCFYKEEKVKSALVICDYQTLEIIKVYTTEDYITFPYIPSFFAFREGPVIVKLLEKIKEKPDLIIFNGHGIAHPEKMGLATHLGIIFDIPTIGCARKILYGSYTIPPSFPLASTFIKDEEGEIIGHVLRNYNNSLLFISPGHKIDLKTSLSVVIKTMKKEYGLPYPLYAAHSNCSL